MAMDRVGMNKLREILRLKYELGVSDRQTAASCHASHSTVAKYLELARQNGLDWAKDRGLDDMELERKVLGSPPKQISYSKVLPDFNYLHSELKRPHVTLALLHEEYKEKHVESAYELSFFCELYHRWKKKLDICMRQDHKAGEKLFVDYCDGEGISIIDRDTGNIRDTQLFVSVWGASNNTYAEASYTQKKEDWLMSHVRAFDEFGCVPYIVVPDNLRTGIDDACLYEPEINRSYTELAEHYGFTVIPARKAHPKDKAKVEKGVNMAQRWILACLRNRRFYSLGELNEAIRELRVKLNDKKLRKIGRTRKELFEELDKPAALPLPERRYEYADWKICRVNIDYHIEVDFHYYSVPFPLKHEQVDVRVTAGVVEIFYRHRRVFSHPRSYKKWDHSTIKEHMPPEHQRYLDQTPSNMLDWAQKVGPNTVEVMKKILESRAFPQQGYRACLGIKRLEGHYSRERIESACRRAVNFRVYSYKKIKSILISGLDKQDAGGINEDTNNPLPAHENIRGQEYYN